ncbi:hypothetical protein [Ruegeria atlantica]|uniref:hypothetical protein n=1 Tax=Ruegeria atlantica TaxID=81569 RepID=UPI0020C4C185|nr:hypothetical protein [Ruegeria atlantica]
MKQRELSELGKIAEATFQKEYNDLRPLIEAEARVQQQLIRLDAQAKQSRQDSASAEGYRVTGTDVLWNGWEAATRRQLNMDLARLRAQKLSAIEALRTAFGRKQALLNLSNARNEARKRALAKKFSEF